MSKCVDGKYCIIIIRCALWIVKESLDFCLWRRRTIIAWMMFGCLKMDLWDFLNLNNAFSDHLDRWSHMSRVSTNHPSPTFTLSCFSRHCHRTFAPAMVTLQSTELGTFTVLGRPDLLYVVTAPCPRRLGGGCQDAPSKELAPLTLCQPRSHLCTGQWKEEDDLLEKKID